MIWFLLLFNKFNLFVWGAFHFHCYIIYSMTVFLYVVLVASIIIFLRPSSSYFKDLRLSIPIDILFIFWWVLSLRYSNLVQLNYGIKCISALPPSCVYPIISSLNFISTALYSYFIPVSYTHLDVYKRQITIQYQITHKHLTTEHDVQVW